MVDLRVRFLFECVFLELYVLALCLVWPPSLKSSSASPLLLEVASASHYLRKHQVPRPPQASACSIISSLLELQRKPLLQTLASPYFEFDPNHPLKPRLCLEQLPPLERLPRGSIEAWAVWLFDFSRTRKGATATIINLYVSQVQTCHYWQQLCQPRESSLVLHRSTPV